VANFGPFDDLRRQARLIQRHRMDVLTITLVTATTALVSAITGPLVSYIVASRQIRASVISTNRERWTEALRDAVAEYVALLLSASMVKLTIGGNALEAVAADHALLEIVERIIRVKNKIMLMTNPVESRYSQLCQVVEASYQALLSDDLVAFVNIRTTADAITLAGREVLRAEWLRVKRGE
jgi:hypothetical protein